MSERDQKELTAKQGNDNQYTPGGDDVQDGQKI